MVRPDFKLRTTIYEVAAHTWGGIMNYMPRRRKTQPYARFQPVVKSCGKVQYMHKLDAEQAAEEAMIMQSGLKLKIYKCLNCGKWHLTRVKQVEKSSETS